MLVGLLLAQGLAYGFSMFFTAGHLATGEESQSTIWATESGFLLWQGLQGAGLLIGGGLAGAGKSRGVIYGSFVGLISGLFSMVIQQGRGDPLEPMMVYGQPVFHFLCGAIGALVATLIWKPLPVMRVSLPPEAIEKRRILPMPVEPLAVPVSWIRVVIGVAIVVAGVLSARSILMTAVNLSEGRLAIQSGYQQRVVIWEICALAALVGAGFAGATTRGGLKHGFLVAIGASVLTAGINLGRPQHTLDSLIVLITGIWIVCIIGGWFGGMLFPPMDRRKRLSD